MRDLIRALLYSIAVWIQSFASRMRIIVASRNKHNLKRFVFTFHSVLVLGAVFGVTSSWIKGINLILQNVGESKNHESR